MRSKGILGLTGAAIVGLMAMAVPASATTIFSDDFSRADNDFVQNGWVVLENDADDVAIVSPGGSNGRMQLRDENAVGGNGIDAAAYHLVTTTGFQNITLSFDWAALTASESDDQLLVEWRTGNSTWDTIAGGTNLFSTGLGGDGSFSGSGTLALGAAANNLANLEIRFRTAVSSSDEGALIDNVIVSGDAIPTAPVGVPEPSSVALLGAGVLGLSAMLRRRKKA